LLPALHIETPVASPVEGLVASEEECWVERMIRFADERLGANADERAA
jgi:hypothetical protein